MNQSENTNIYSFKLFDFHFVNVNPACTTIPSPRSGHRILCTARYIYLYGGYNPSLNPPTCQDIWKFNFATRKWKRCAENQNIPNEVTSIAAVRRKHELLVFGGTAVPFGFRCSNKLHSFHVNDKTESFSTYRISGKSPQSMYGQAMVLHKNLLYVIGGTDGFTFTCDIHRVNLNKDVKVWKQMYKTSRITVDNCEDNAPYEPEGRYRHEVGFDGNNIFLIGGGTSCKSYNLTEIPIFNIASRTWRRETSIAVANGELSYPQPRKCHGLVQFKSGNKNYVYIVCGLGDEGALNDLWRLQLSTLQWTLIKNPVLPKGLYFHATALSYHGKMYIFGGINGSRDLKRTNDIYCAWMYIPKLSEICWEAVLYYIGYKNVTKTILRQLKVPERFINRLS
ncbi:hypothetical protein ILUMI_22406 [Ignelater luminosus]|uniref:Kelch domain-containing protein 10 n=1 Tax=Ignelater luminosus TaxID=2038154 RepID=A0A8K0CCV5_IGNLU|nr:hypothetical protein ILUMI_22406 [Ignelater luminosus]